MNNGKSNIPRLTSEMLSKFPDQASSIINRLIDEVNALRNASQ